MASTTPANSAALPTPRGREENRSRQLPEPFPLARRQRAKLPFKAGMRKSTMLALLAGLTLLGTAIRLLITHGLSVEEILAAGPARRSLGDLVPQLARHGVHPPLQPFLEWCSVHLLGGGDFVLRLPSLLAGAAVVPAVAALARELFDRRTAIVAATLASISPILVWYSQQASGYVFVALFGTLALLGAARAGRRGEPTDWALHAVAAALAVWSDWSGIFILAASELVLLDGLLRHRERGERSRPYLAGWALESVALLSQFIPLALLFSDELSRAGSLTGLATVGASGVSFYSTVSNVSWGLFGFHPAVVTDALSAVWPLGMLASLLMIGRSFARQIWLLVACALLPALATLALGIAAPGAFDIRYALAGIPVLMVLLGALATRWAPGPAGKVVVSVAVVALLGGALVDQQTDPKNPRRYDYRAALTQARHEAGPRTAVLFAPAELRIVFDRDAPGLRAAVLGPQVPARPQASGVVLVTSFTGRPAVRALLNRDLGALRATRHLLSHHVYPGVEVWSFR